MNPYEMRFNYFNAARDLLRDEYQANFEKLHFCEDTEEKNKQLFSLKYPNREDIFALAEQIKEFTDKK